MQCFHFENQNDFTSRRFDEMMKPIKKESRIEKNSKRRNCHLAHELSIEYEK